MVALIAFATLLAPSSVVAPGATLVQVESGCAFTEGPAADRHGNVFFTDQPNDRILVLAFGKGGTKTVTEWLKPSGRSNGMAFDHRGNLIACADGENQLVSIAHDKKVTVLVKEFDRKLLNGPNDLWIRPDDAIYFTDPLYARDYWKRDPKMQQAGQQVFFLSKDRKTLKTVTNDLKTPNGIVGTPDGKTLYVSDLGSGVTYRYAVQPDGSLGEKTLFCSQGSDGMTLDAEGNLYLTGSGVTVYDKTGAKTEHIDVPQGWTANVTFGGPDFKTLVITAGTSVYTLQMRVRGAKGV